MKKYQLLLFVFVTLTLCQQVSAQKMFMKIKGLPGESQDMQHRDWISLDGFKQGLSARTGSTGSARAGVGKTGFDDIIVTKKLDKATPLLMQKCATGEIFPEVELELTAADGKTMYRVVLTDVRISGVQSSAACNPACQTTEEISLNYSKISWEHTDSKGAPVRAGYDLKMNKKI